MKRRKVNIRLIWDHETIGTKNQGWYTRHDETDENGNLILGCIAIDDALGDEDMERAEAIELACQRFGCELDDIEIFD